MILLQKDKHQRFRNTESQRPSHNRVEIDTQFFLNALLEVTGLASWVVNGIGDLEKECPPGNPPSGHTWELTCPAAAS